MNDDDNVHRMTQEVPFTIDGQPFTTRDRRQTASDLLRLAGLDPTRYDLGELRGRAGVPKRYADADEVTVTPNARFVSIRHAAEVA